MIEEKEKKNEELEVVLEEAEKEKEVSVTPNPLDDSLIDMKNAIIGKINAGPPNPMPLCMSFNGKNPS